MFCSSQALGLDHWTDAVVFGLKRSAELGLFSVNLMYLFSDKRQGKKCGRPNRLRMILSSPYGAATRGANLVPRSTIFSLRTSSLSKHNIQWPWHDGITQAIALAPAYIPHIAVSFHFLFYRLPPTNMPPANRRRGLCAPAALNPLVDFCNVSLCLCEFQLTFDRFA